MKRFLSLVMILAIILSISIPVFAGTEPVVPQITTDDAASARIKEDSGLRFTSKIDKAEYDALISTYGAENVKVGTLITPAVYVEEAGAFTKTALDALNKKSEKYLDIVATAPYAETESAYVFAGSITNILENHYNLPFAAIGYIEVNGTVRYSESYCVRTVSGVATAAYADLSTTQTGEYTEKVREGLYSPYDSTQRNILNSLRDPSVYEIGSIAQWNAFTTLVNYGVDRFEGKKVVLTADLDFSEVENYIPVGNNPAKGDTDIIHWGDSYTLTDVAYFAGTFDGQGHRISGVKETFTNGHTGLFGVTYGAEIKNLRLEASFTNTSGAWNNGLLIGLAMNTNVDSCHISGKYGTTSAGLVGGIIGTAGLVVNVTNSICDADCSELGNQYAGGFVGYAFGGANFTYVGIKNSYLLTPDVKNQNGYISALIGHGGGTKNVANCYVAYTGAGSTQTLVDGGNETILQSAVITVDELKGKTSVLGSAFAAVENNVPILKYETTTDVLEIETAEDWVAFATAVNNGNTYSGTIVKLVADLDLSSINFVPVGNNAGKGDNDFITWGNTYDVTNAKYFAGIFDGNGYSITGLNVSFNQGYTGLFGMTYGAKICNLSLNANFTNASGAWHNGLLVGLAINTEIESCYVAGKYSSDTAGLIGGVVGTAANSLTIRNTICEVDCSALGNQYSGGIVGYAFGANNFTSVALTNCYLKTPAVSNKSSSAISLLIGDGSGSKLLNNSYVILTGECGVTALANSATIFNNSKIISDEELKGMTATLGSAFKTGSNGYPVLVWME